MSGILNVVHYFKVGGRELWGDLNSRITVKEV
jgi:hypothetical protein